MDQMNARTDRHMDDYQDQTSSVTSPENSGRSSVRGRKSAGAFRTISEVADELDVQQHVLRFWETKFTQVKPLKRGGGRRYYRPEDVALLKTIHNLLYTEGYTIKGAQKLLKGQGKQQIIAGDLDRPRSEHEAVLPQEEAQAVPTLTASRGFQSSLSGERLDSKQRTILEAMLGDLKDLRSMIKGE